MLPALAWRGSPPSLLPWGRSVVSGEPEEGARFPPPAGIGWVARTEHPGRAHAAAFFLSGKRTPASQVPEELWRAAWATCGRGTTTTWHAIIMLPLLCRAEKGACVALRFLPERVAWGGRVARQKPGWAMRFSRSVPLGG